MSNEILFSGPFTPPIGSDFATEDLSSQIPVGGTTTFTTSVAFQPTRLLVYRNGLFQGPPGGSEINVLTNETFSFTIVVAVGENVSVVYSPQIKT
tara:strand:+ start:292 stop:576 length:285 start_codon:yes stop_codon:yes gene_type:complete